jgi:hypothetical protein
MRLMSNSGGGVDDEGGAPARRVACGAKPSPEPPSPGIGALSLFIFLATTQDSGGSKIAPQKNFGIELLCGARTETGELEERFSSTNKIYALGSQNTKPSISERK